MNAADNYAVEAKNGLLQLLLVNDSEKLLQNIDAVLIVLENTHGLWQALNYCYKAAEIAERCRREIYEISSQTTHHKRLDRLNKLMDRACAAEKQYARFQQLYVIGQVA